MNKKQKAALKQLERAFAKCKDAGLAFCGMDSDILAYDADQLLEADNRLGCMYLAQSEISNDLDEAYQVDTKYTYKDSGGW